LIPNFFIRARRVVRFVRKRAAASVRSAHSALRLGAEPISLAALGAGDDDSFDFQHRFWLIPLWLTFYIQRNGSCAVSSCFGIPVALTHIGEESVMLRITIHDKAPETSFVIEGNLVGPWVKELEKCWVSALAAEPSRAMAVNLAAVTFIDHQGRELLTRMRRLGVRLVSAGLLMNAIVDEIEAEAKKEM